MAALNRNQITAGILTATAILGLCSCTSDPAPDASATPTPAITTTDTATPQPDTSPTAEVTETPEVIRNLAEADFPALKDGYEYSDTPQGPSEQWIYDRYPDMWEEGVRALTPETVVPNPNVYADPAPRPGVTVQYIGGERFEGTNLAPLTFHDRTTTDGNQPPQGVIDWWIANTGRDDATIKADDNLGWGMWILDLQGNTISLTLGGAEAYEVDGKKAAITFDNQDAAKDWIRAENIQLPKDVFGDEARALNPGEWRAMGITGSEAWIYNPATDEFVVTADW